MALESTTYINGLVATNPAGTDARSQGDDHIRMVKSAVKATFPNITGAVTATHTELNLIDGVTATTAELNYVDGVTSNVQTQLNAKSPLASPTFTGTPAAPTASAGTNTTQVATTAFVEADVTAHAAFRSSQTVYGHAKIYTSGGDLYIVTT
tara:strand:- start:644 stop:1099 length:456 start_codon:yes stop_codon:yes gene_type:complete